MYNGSYALRRLFEIKRHCQNTFSDVAETGCDDRN